MRSALFWVVTLRVVLNPYRRLGTTYRVKAVPTACSETSAMNYQYSLRKNPEERRSPHLDRGRSLMSRAAQRCLLQRNVQQKISQIKGIQLRKMNPCWPRTFSVGHVSSLLNPKTHKGTQHTIHRFSSHLKENTRCLF